MDTGDFTSHLMSLLAEAHKTINNLTKTNKMLISGISSLPTFDCESVTYGFDSDHEMVDQEQPLSDEYCGDYIEVKSLKELIKEKQ